MIFFACEWEYENFDTINGGEVSCMGSPYDSREGVVWCGILSVVSQAGADTERRKCDEDSDGSHYQ